MCYSRQVLLNYAQKTRKCDCIKLTSILTNFVFTFGRERPFVYGQTYHNDPCVHVNFNFKFANFSIFIFVSHVIHINI